MKKYFYLLLLIIVLLVGIAYTFASDNVSFKTRSISDWVGERFIFQPQEKGLQKFGYPLIYKANQTIGVLPYDEYVGRIAKVTKVTPSPTGINGSWIVDLVLEDTSERIKANAVLNQIKRIAPVADIENARVRYIGKTLWLQNSPLRCFKKNGAGVESISVDTSKPVKVIDVVASWENDAPVRFIVQTGDGQKGFVDVSMSGTNVSDILRKHSKFEVQFLTEKPQINSSYGFGNIPNTSSQSSVTLKQNDVLGWQGSRWGMTEMDIVRTFGASLKKLSKRNLYKNRYVDYVIPNLNLNKEIFTVHFQMDARTNRLIQILISLDQRESDSPRNDIFLGLEEILSQKYGTPSYKKDKEDKIGSFLTIRERQWSFPSTIIELNYDYSKNYNGIFSIDVTIRYFPASLSDANKL